jgi:hypothetical protein
MSATLLTLLTYTIGLGVDIPKAVSHTSLIIAHTSSPFLGLHIMAVSYWTSYTASHSAGCHPSRQERQSCVQSRSTFLPTICRRLAQVWRRGWELWGVKDAF